MKYFIKFLLFSIFFINALMGKIRINNLNNTMQAKQLKLSKDKIKSTTVVGLTF